ncbi:MAG: hypothetical protein P8Z81_13535 [Deinococcales bacterium]
MKRLSKARLLITLVAVVLAAGLATASAQDDWIGIRSGYPLGVTLHLGIGNALGNGTDLRVSGRIEVHNNVARYGLGIDAMHDILYTSPFSVYIGAGPAIEFGSGSTWLDVHALAGSEFRFVPLGVPQLGLFLEGTVGALIGVSTAASESPSFGLALGVNYHF